ncbi:hypothetical protein [Pontibacter vulgaris]|uniref:hypothetical protein n=1 Tax=Pontibacter vulgaris TaxID=2905679 RepID=UPI001FA78B54|nr:hypothetical protein [Pontibacter vulgaris]
MLKFKKIIGHYFKYPLMWVMLLWALTLPGHEVIVYDYLIQTISDTTPNNASGTTEAFSKSRELAQEGQAFIDAATPSFVVKNLQPAKFIPELLAYTFCSAKAPVLYSRSADRPFLFFKRFLVSILPNAP